MIGITAQQSRLLHFIESRIRQEGAVPSYESMADHMGLASKASIGRLVDQLESRGRIRRTAKRARSIEVVKVTCPKCGAQL